jgi:hypothetical protein
MFKKFDEFLINNKKRENDIMENFDEFTFNFEGDIDVELQNIINHLNNDEGVQYYRNLIIFHFLNLSNNNDKVIKII